MPTLPGSDPVVPSASASAWPSRYPFPFVLLILATTALACTDDHPSPIVVSPTPDAGSAMVCSPEAVVDPTALLDDFEHVGSSGAPLIAGRSGGWYASHDTTKDGIMQPNGDAAPEAIPGGR